MDKICGSPYMLCANREAFQDISMLCVATFLHLYSIRIKIHAYTQHLDYVINFSPDLLPD